MYLNPRKLNEKSDRSSLCSEGAGSVLHMMLECPPVAQFWTQVASRLSNSLNIIHLNRHIVLPGLTAAKKIIVLNPDHSLSVKHWFF